VDTWAAHFRSGRTSVEDDERPGRPSRDDFWAIVSDYWEKKLYTSCREIIKELFVLRIIILQALGKIAFRFFIARWVPRKLSVELKAKKSRFVKRCWKFWKNSVRNKTIMLLQVTNAEFTRTITIVENGQQIVERCLLESI
jgi:hypothetical protein